MTIKGLTAEQGRILRAMEGLLPLAADIAQAKISLVLPVTEEREARVLAGIQGSTGADGEELFLEICAQAEPLTRVDDVADEPAANAMEDGSRALVPVRLADEPLTAQTLRDNQVTEGMREFILGQYARMKVFPVCDAAGTCFAAAAFEDREADVVFWDATMDFLRTSTGVDSRNACYRRMASIDGLVLINARNKEILAANNAARHIYRVLGVGMLVGRRTNSMDIHWNGVTEVCSSGEAYEEEIRQKGLTLDIRFLPLNDSSGRPRQLIAIIEDVTQLKLKDEELRVQSAMIKEIHHRVKNNLQTIASLLRLEQRRARSQETKTVLKDSINRISSIALVHEYLSTQGTEEVDMAALGRDVFRTVLSSMGNPELHLQTAFTAESLLLPSQKAASLALVLNELVQNSLEHGFEGCTQGTLAVDLFETPGNVILRVTDDGTGLPKDFQPGRSKSLGLKIVQTVVTSDLKGVFYLHNRTDGVRGAMAEVILPRV
ncbi:MAG: sensor histidine kinase [Succiniclasticum sp.]|jgi:two-component sensor histidine kinase|nr:sensor histidine kinase [Succiniclasticum sp.]MEE3478802.1 sensor histidine kinase [Succiniclasticum sp.]